MVVVVSSAVTRTVMAVVPSERAMASLAVPLPTVAPSTVTVALPVSSTVGVSFAWVMVLVTLPVYAVVSLSKVEGGRVRALNGPSGLVLLLADNPLRSALLEGGVAVGMPVFLTQ